MRLVVAEKPSMARAIAEALGVTGKGRSYLQGESGGQKVLITWCVGHLVEAAEPESYGAKQWSFSNLPIVPEQFQFRVNQQTADQFAAVRGLLLRDDVTEIVNATDAGREGQLIFHLTYDLAGCQKNVIRLWTSSLTDDAIRDAWGKMKPESDYQGLTDAARCRQEADWLVGINCTRAQTLVARSRQQDGVFSVGRVQTPTLAMLVGRELEIRNFVPKDFWTIQAKFRSEDGKAWTGRWFRPEQKDGDPADAGTGERLATQQEADELRQRLLGKPAKVLSTESKKEKRRPELLYDLTGLQREANRRFGYTAEQTLEIAQQLYEAQLISYPRTSSRHLTKDDAAKAPTWVAALDRGPYAEFVSEIKGFGKGNVPALGPRFVDDAQVEDHSGLVVTNKAVRIRDGVLDLPQDQARIYDLIARRLLAAWYPDRIEQKSTIITVVYVDPQTLEHFRTRGTVVVDLGWSKVDAAPKREPKKKVEGQGDDADDDAGELPVLTRGQKANTDDVSVKAGKTSPPRPMSEADLLAAMQGAGKLLDDDELRGAMKDSGLGTPATRAGIIETLLKRGYVDRRGRAMVATQRGIDLIASIQVAALKSPELTGSWEATMEQIRRGKAERTVFMAQIRSFVAQLVDGIRGEGQRTAKGHTSALGACPECGSNLYTRTFGERQHISCSALARPDCGYGYDCDASGEPTAGRCPHCQGPRRQDRQGQVTCLRCGRPPVADPQRPAPPPMMNCPQCRQLLRTIWSAKKNQWLLRCGPCNSWVDPPLASQVGDEPKVLPCDRCQAPSMPIWSSQKRAWLWRCTRCVGWGWVVNT